MSSWCSAENNRVALPQGGQHRVQDGQHRAARCGAGWAGQVTAGVLDVHAGVVDEVHAHAAVAERRCVAVAVADLVPEELVKRPGRAVVLKAGHR